MTSTSIPEMKQEFIRICKEKISRAGVNELLEWLEDSDFYQAPASSKFHSNFDGGLVYHSLNVYYELVKLNEIYETNISEESIAICALFHDLCKVHFYKKGFRNVKDDETGKWYQKPVFEIDEKVPLGHGEKSCIILQNYMQLQINELLAIRWHMNGFDCSVKGGDYSLNKAMEISPLVLLLSVADMVASNLREFKVV